MKIKIIKCKRSNYWYKDFVGQIFDTYQDRKDNSKFWVKRTPVSTYGKNWPVSGMDAKRLNN